jgi:outer membrane lipopolysaccharide assembly protein LptE/RlpB
VAVQGHQSCWSTRGTQEQQLLLSAKITVKQYDDLLKTVNIIIIRRYLYAGNAKLGTTKFFTLQTYLNNEVQQY